jgi:hypothetical protein
LPTIKNGSRRSRAADELVTIPGLQGEDGDTPVAACMFFSSSQLTDQDTEELRLRPGSKYDFLAQIRNFCDNMMLSRVAAQD